MDSEFVHVCTKYTVYSIYDQVCIHLMLFPWHSGIISFRKAKRTRTYTSMLRFKNLILRTKFVREKKHKIHQHPDHSFRFTLSLFTNLKTWFGKGFPFLNNPTTPEAWDYLLLEFYQWTSSPSAVEVPLKPGGLMGHVLIRVTYHVAFLKSWIYWIKLYKYVWIIYANGIMITFKNQEQIPKNTVYIYISW